MLEHILAFHFLRPSILLFVPLICVLALYIRRKTQQNKQTDEVIATHLKAALTTKQSWTNKLKPIDLTFLIGILLCLAAAGPTWRPLSQDGNQGAPLAIILKLSNSMLANDISSTRLQRAKQKIHDLLRYRSGSKHSLIVYASSSHRVLPLTEDIAVFDPFIDALSPEIMPHNQAILADDLANAIALAQREVAELGGSILVIADDISKVQISKLNESKTPFLWWQFATEKGGSIVRDDGILQTNDKGEPLVLKLDNTIKQQLDHISSTRLTVNQQDIVAIDSYTKQSLNKFQRDNGARYEDMGWYMAWFIAGLLLLWFRKGWTSVLPSPQKTNSIVSITCVLLISIGLLPKVYAKPVDWFLTKDQQASIRYNKLKFGQAAELFEDKNWQAKAYFENGNYLKAAEIYATLNTPEAFYNRATSLLKAHEYALAIKAFEQVLQLAPHDTNAQYNLAIAKQAYKVVIAQAGQEDLEQNIALDVEENKVAETTSGEFVDYQVNDSLAPDAKEKWMQTVESDMAEFLASKFANDLIKGKP